MMTTEAIGAVVRKIDREWGTYGYRVSEIVQAVYDGAALAEVHHFDGSVFYVASDRYGNTVHGETLDECTRALRDRVAAYAS